MDSSKIIDYYKTHNVRDTQKKFGITYKELLKICSEGNFIKSKEQIRETYKTTKAEKYGSLDAAYSHMVKAKEKTILRKYGSYDLYYEIRDNNNRKTNLRNSGFAYPMMNPKTKEKRRKK